MGKLDTRPARPSRGWAPGGYLCNCSICKDPFQGSKRATVCADCSHDESKWKTEPLPATGIEAMVCEDIRKRQEFGLNKYGTTVADSPERLREWLKHAYLEHLDAAIYLRKAIDKIDRGEFFT